MVSDRVEEPFDVVLEAARVGAGWAAERIWTSLAPRVAGYLRAGGADEPDDLTSEVFLRVFAGCRSFSGTEAQFRSWVFTVAHSRLVDARRVRNRTPETTSVEEEGLDVEGPSVAGAEEEAMGRLGTENVQRLLGVLTCDQSDVLVLRVLGRMSVEEAAAVLEKRPGAVSALQRRGLATLRRRLASEANRHEPWER